MSRARLSVIGAGAVLVSLVAGGAFMASRGAERDDTSAAAAPATAAAAVPAKPAPPAVLAEAVNQDPPVTVQVVAAKRTTPDTLRVDLVLVSRSTAPEALDLSPLARSATSAPGATSESGAADAASGLRVADLCLLTSDGSRRLFPLRDAEDKPVGGGDFAPLAPGERRAVWVVFPAPPAGDTRITLLVGGLTLQNVQISADSGQP